MTALVILMGLNSKCMGFPFLPLPPKSSPDLNLHNEVYKDDTSKFQGQFNHAEFVFHNDVALKSTGVAVELVKVGKFCQKLPQNDQN